MVGKVKADRRAGSCCSPSQSNLVRHFLEKEVCGAGILPALGLSQNTNEAGEHMHAASLHGLAVYQAHGILLPCYGSGTLLENHWF